MTTDNEVMTIIIEYMISQAKSREYIEKLNIIMGGIRGYKHIEQERSPSYQSILLFGYNIFIFKTSHYRLMAQELLRGK